MFLMKYAVRLSRTMEPDFAMRGMNDAARRDFLMGEVYETFDDAVMLYDPSQKASFVTYLYNKVYWRFHDEKCTNSERADREVSCDKMSFEEDMSEDEIRRAMEDAKKYEAWDKERKAAMDTRNAGERLAYEAEQALSNHKALDKDAKKRIKEDTAALKKAVHKTKPEEITTEQAAEIRRLMEQLQKSAAGILSGGNGQAQV